MNKFIQINESSSPEVDNFHHDFTFSEYSSFSLCFKRNWASAVSNTACIDEILNGRH